MMKFFRKYNKQLLAVFMVLLMVVFVGGSALQSLFTPTNDRVVAHSRVGDISMADQAHARYTTGILNRLGMDWQNPLGRMGEPLTEMDWILLTREAKKAGMYAGEAAARRQMTDDRDAENIDAFARQARIQPAHIYQAVAEFQSVRQAGAAVMGAANPSVAELNSVARKTLEKVKIKAVVLPASAFIEPAEEGTEEFTDEELAAHLDKYREREPGTGLDFGYYVKTKVRAQFIRIERDKIAETINIPDLERKAKTYYRANLDDPLFARAPEPAEDDVEGPKEEKPAYMPWEEAKDAAIRVVRKQQADEMAGRIANWLVDHAAEPWFEIDRGEEDQYKIAPAIAARPEYYAELVDQIPASIRFEGAVKPGFTAFFSQEDAGTVPLIGATFSRDSRGNRKDQFRTLVFRTKAIVPEVPKEKGINPADYLAEWQTCSFPVFDPETEDLFVFRVAESEPGHPAKSVDEVRDRVVEDLRLLRAYDVAEDTRGHCGRPAVTRASRRFLTLTPICRRGSTHPWTRRSACSSRRPSPACRPTRWAVKHNRSSPTCSCWVESRVRLSMIASPSRTPRTNTSCRR